MNGLAAVDTTGSVADHGEPVETTIWDQATLSKVTAFAATMEEISAQRDEVNARKAAAIVELVNLGFNKDAIGAALKYHNTPEEKRANFDLSYIYARKAFGAPIQDDLFSAAMQQQVEVAKAAPVED